MYMEYPMSDTTQTEMAMPLARLPRIGEPAVPFRVRTTLGERTLEGYRGHNAVTIKDPIVELAK